MTNFTSGRSSSLGTANWAHKKAIPDEEAQFLGDGEPTSRFRSRASLRNFTGVRGRHEMIEDNIRRKIENLITRAPPLFQSGGVARDTRHLAACEAWITEALNVIQLTIPAPNNAYRVRIEKTGGGGAVQQVASISEMLRALLPDIDDGLLGDLGNKIRAETFDDFLDHAELYVQKGRKMEAGVIAGVVFEDTIRRIHRDKIADDTDLKLEDVINALAKQNVITGLQSKQAKVAAHVRTKATHAQWDEFELPDVESTIQITKRFLADHLGG